jgi:pimeloyl-ACP methyl ester carboxylesterase
MVQNARMLNHKIAFRLAVMLLFAVWNIAAQQIPSAITSDPAPDKEYPAGVEAPDILSHGSRLNTVLFLASGAASHPTVLLLHGFPGNEKNLDLAYTLRRAGWNVLFPNYRGSWGSAGTFSFSNALEDAQAALEFLRDPANVKKYRIDQTRIVLIGHSMGGFIAADRAAHDPGVFALCMMAAWNIGPTVLRASDNGRVDTYKNSSPRLAGTTPEGLMAEAKNNASKWNYVDYANLLKSRPVLIMEAKDRNKDDNHEMAEALRKAGDSPVIEKYLETDHSFSDHRIALQAAILEWLQSLPAPVAK